MSYRLLRLTILAAILTLAVPTLALAHPLGNFTVNHYSRIEPAGDGLRIFYVLDMAEIPAFQEQARIDTSGDGQVSDDEQSRYAMARAEEIRSNLHLTLDGVPTDVRLDSQSLSFPPGQGGLSTLRLEALFTASGPFGADRPLSLTYRDDNDLTRLGWREIVARPGAVGTRIEQATVPADDRTDELRSYPDDMLSSPLDIREARITFIPGTASAESGWRAPSGVIDRGTDVYAALAATENLSPSVILFSLGTALVLGAFHALSPGHGKTVVAAYLVGSRGTAGHAIFLGATVTATHTAGVYALGVVTLFLSEYILPERLYPVLEVISGLLVVAVGGWLFAGRLRGALAQRSGVWARLPWLRQRDDGRAAQQAYDHAHAHGLAHTHDVAHATASAHAHAGSGDRAHGHSDAHERASAAGQTREYAYASGHAHEQPRASHATVERHDHDRDPAQAHEHPHAEDSGHGHAHDHGHAHAQDHGHAHAHDHAHTEAAHESHTHSHGGSTHSHLPPGADGQPVTWRSLLALGVSGGLLPCPSALVVLLSAIALHRVAFGLLLIVAFSIGLASVLVAIGLLLVYARGLLERFSVGGGAATRLLPVVSAFLIMIAGLVITIQALPRLL